MNSTRNRILTAAILLVVLLGGVYYLQTSGKSKDSASQSSAASPSPTASSSVAPTATGAAGLEITQPQPLARITSPLTITGKAMGNWYFEGQFPVSLLDENGTTITRGTARADGEWMTEAPFPFTATLTFTKPATAKGTLKFENDNPSGLPQNAKSYTVPVQF